MPRRTLENFQLSSDDDYHGSGEKDVAEHCRDGDSYGTFSTDYDKFAWDESRWTGISNVRKHCKKIEKAKKDKTEEQGKLETRSKPGEREES